MLIYKNITYPEKVIKIASFTVHPLPNQANNGKKNNNTKPRNKNINK